MNCILSSDVFILLKYVYGGFDSRNPYMCEHCISLLSISQMYLTPSNAVTRLPMLLFLVLPRQLQKILEHSLIKAGAVQSTIIDVNKWRKPESQLSAVNWQAKNNFRTFGKHS